GDVKPSVEEEIEKMNPEEYKNAFSTLKQRLVRGWSIALTVMGGIIGLFGIWLLCKPKAKEEAE
nr:3A [Tortoise rafivirus A]